MQITANTSVLLGAASAAGRVIRSGYLPILECILFEREEDSLKVTGSNLDIWITNTIRPQFDDWGLVAIPSGQLLATLKALPDVSCRVSVDNNFHVTITTDKGKYEIAGMDGQDFPRPPEIKDGIQVEMSADDLKRIVDTTSFAVTTDTARPGMMGVFFSIGTRAEFVATDGHRLVRLRMDSITSEREVNATIPRAALEATKILHGDGTILLSDGDALFEFGDTTLHARLVEGMFPNYQAVIPDPDKSVTFDTEALLNAVKRVGLYCAEKTEWLSLTLGDTHLFSRDTFKSNAAREEVVGEYDGHEVFGFNPRYLVDALSRIDDDEVTMEFISPSRPVLFRPTIQDAGEDLMMLVVPLSLATYPVEETHAAVYA